MCFNRKKLKKLQETVDELTNIVKTQELVRLREESLDFKKTKELLSKVKFKVKDIKPVLNEETGLTSIFIRYELPIISLNLDDNGEPNKNDFFYSTNVLEMIDVEDMKKICDVLENEKVKKIKNNS